MTEYSISTELFQLEESSTPILYAPLQGVACQADAKVINLLCDIQEGIALSSPQSPPLLEKLLKLGLIQPTASQPAISPRTTPALDAPFLPCEVTLFLTGDCNLACRYCYGNGGEVRSSMPDNIARAAIDQVFHHAALTNTGFVRVGFHGGGEPTLKLIQIQQLTEYASQRAKKENIQISFSLTTNGTMGGKALSWITKHINDLNISFDGPEDIQNFQRPRKGGDSSFDRVVKTLKQLDADGKQYYLRGTITDYSQKRIPEIASFIVENFNPHTLQLEPMFRVGRAIDSELAPPQSDLFVKGFLKAEKICRQAGVILKFSGFRFPRIHGAFCGIGRKNFAVTPEGYVTSCFEVLDIDDPRKEVFFYGAFQNGAFVFDQDKIQKLRLLSEDIPSYCKDCFAQFHCTGDCRGKGLYHHSLTSYQGAGRCEIVQKLITNMLARFLKDTPEGGVHG